MNPFDEYRPIVRGAHLREKLEASYDELKGRDLKRLIARLVDNELSRDWFTAMLQCPRLFQAAMETAKNQRPCARFQSFVMRNADPSGWLRRQQDFESFGNLLLGKGEWEESVRWEGAFRSVLAALEKELSSRAPMRSALQDELDSFVHVTTGQMMEDANHINTIPVNVFDLRSAAETYLEYFRLLGDTFSDPGFNKNDWDSDGRKRVSMMASAAHLNATDWTPGARLVRLGLLEVDADRRPETIDEARELLPPGAQFAGVELVAAMLRYPRLAQWPRLHPMGGYRGGHSFSIWALGFGPIYSPKENEFLCFSVNHDVYDRPWVSAPWVHELSSGFRPDSDFIAYTIPVHRWSVPELNAMT